MQRLTRCRQVGVPRGIYSRLAASRSRGRGAYARARARARACILKKQCMRRYGAATLTVVRIGSTHLLSREFVDARGNHARMSRSGKRGASLIRRARSNRDKRSTHHRGSSRNCRADKHRPDFAETIFIGVRVYSRSMRIDCGSHAGILRIAAVAA